MKLLILVGFGSCLWLLINVFSVIVVCVSWLLLVNRVWVSFSSGSGVLGLLCMCFSEVWVLVCVMCVVVCVLWCVLCFLGVVSVVR